jgi:hypothetical protein
MSKQQFPRLDNLMGGWFHQDFDIEGNTLEEIIGSYTAVTPAETQAQLVAEIREFLEKSPDVDREFEEQFTPQIVTTDFASRVLKNPAGRIDSRSRV